MGERCDILLFGTMGEIAQVISRDLESHGLKTISIPFAQNTRRDDFGYCRLLTKTLATLRPRVIFPIGHPLNLSLLKESRPELFDGIRVPVETPEKISLLDSKTECCRFVSTIGVLQPRFYTLEEAMNNEDFKRMELLNLIFKREKSFGGSGVHRPKNLQSLHNLAMHEPGNEYLIQDYIEGKDVSVDCLRMNGTFEAHCYETVAKCQGAGPSVTRKPTECGAIVDIARTILSAVDYQGVCGMDFRLDESGTPYFLECNPRFCGGIETQIESGFDLPWLLYRAATE